MKRNVIHFQFQTTLSISRDGEQYRKRTSKYSQVAFHGPYKIWKQGCFTSEIKEKPVVTNTVCFLSNYDTWYATPRLAREQIPKAA
jgi:hypothetical protein